jgi:hypothetical protein
MITTINEFRKFNEDANDNDAFVKKHIDDVEVGDVIMCEDGGDMHFTYFCMPGSSVTKDLKAAAKEFGVKIDVDKLSSDYYEITVVPNNFKKNKIEPATDYTELDFKMDKFMPDDKETQDEYHKLLDAGDKPGLINFFMNNADFEKMDQYMPGDGTPDGFIDYLLANKNK